MKTHWILTLKGVNTDKNNKRLMMMEKYYFEFRRKRQQVQCSGEGTIQAWLSPPTPKTAEIQICSHLTIMIPNIYSRITQIPIHVQKCRSTCGKNKSLDFVFLICAFVALFLFGVNSFQWFGFKHIFHLSNNLHKHHQPGQSAEPQNLA